MGLLVTDVTLRDFRNFESLDLSLSPGVTVLVGPNAVGKTNTVEAVQLLTSGTSFRRPAPAQLVREGATSARIDARLVGDGRVVDHRCDATPGGRRFSRNGKRCRAADMPEELPSVLFSPDDLALVKRGASQRRDELDLLGRQVSRGYAHVLAEYQRAVDQRNRLLRDERVDLSLLDAWDASVALGGATLLAARMRLFVRLAEKVGEAYGVISGGEALSCSYVCTLGENLEELKSNGFYERCGRYLSEKGLKRTDVIRSFDSPIGTNGTVAILRGNLAPDGAVVKHSAVPKEMFNAVLRARPFDSEEEAIAAVLSHDIKPGDAVIIRYEGPKGSGMPEMFYTTEAISSDGELGRTIALITDGRFSGASKGPAIGHVSPEAAEGGPIALVEPDDLIEISIPDRKLDIVGVKGRRISPEEVSAELERRRKEWKPRPSRYKSGVLSLFIRHAVSPMKGGYME